ncbi:hypothetical protein V8E36_005049 [Tilletia maclaganii]
MRGMVSRMNALLLLLLLPSGAAAASLVMAGENEAALQPRAANSGLRMLSTANWTESISKGAWLVNFCAASSVKCEEFEPVWAELQKTKDFLSFSYPAAPFTLAKVDCLQNRFFCGQQGVEHTPHLNLYIDGQVQEERFQGLREYVQLSEWIESHARQYRKSKNVSDVAPTQQQPSGVSLPASASASAKPAPQPQPVPAPAAQPAPAPPKPPAPAGPPPVAGPVGPNPHGELLSFGQGPLPDLAALNVYLGEGSPRGAAFVKFYAPWCPHCRAMAKPYERLAAELKNRVNVIEVNCEKYADVCRRYGVRSFPTLKMYNDGDVTEYLGGRNLEAMKTWAIKAGSTAGVQLIEKSDELNDHVARSEVVFLYLAEYGVSKSDSKIVEKATRVLLTTNAQFVQSSSDELLRRFSPYLLSPNPDPKASSPSQKSRSAILVFKDHASERPVKAFYPGRVAWALSGGAGGAADEAGGAGQSLHSSKNVNAQLSAQIVEWLSANRYPTLSEITGTNFGDVIHNKQGALVVLAALSDIHHGGIVAGTGSGARVRDAEERALLELARKWRSEQGPRESMIDGEAGGPQLGQERVGDGPAAAAAKAGGKKGKPRSRKIIWAWIDADRWAKALREYYGISAQDLPALVLVDGSRLEYFRLPTHIDARDGKSWLDIKADDLSRPNSPFRSAKGLTTAGTHPVFETIYAALRGEIKPRSSRTYVDRSVRSAEQRISGLVDWSIRHPILSFAFVLAVLGLLVSYVRAVQGSGGPGAGGSANGGSSLPHYHAGTKAE